MKLLIIDFLNTVIRSVAVHQQLEFNGIHTGGLFGTINQLASIANKYQPEHILLCKDHPPYLRKADYPSYKQDRKKMDEDFSTKISTSIELVSLLFDLFKIPTWSEPGLEADDLIATAVRKHRKTYEQIYIVSNDSDLFQLFENENITLLRKGKEYSIKDFNEEFPNIAPEDWAFINALCGTHNGVKGINRVGLKTAINYYFNESKLKSVYEQHQELIDANIKLIELPYQGKRVKVPKIEPPQLNETELTRYMEMYGIRYINRMSEAFYPYSTRRMVHE